MSNASPQQYPKQDDSPERQMLLAHKHMLLGIYQQLQPPANLLNIEMHFITTLIEDLNSIVIEMKTLKGNAEAREYVRNVGKIHEMIRDYALVELYTALRKLDEGDIQEY